LGSRFVKLRYEKLVYGLRRVLSYVLPIASIVSHLPLTSLVNKYQIALHPLSWLCYNDKLPSYVFIILLLYSIINSQHYLLR